MIINRYTILYGEWEGIYIINITSVKHFFHVQFRFVVVERWAVNRNSFEMDTNPQSEN